MVGSGLHGLLKLAVTSQRTPHDSGVWNNSFQKSFKMGCYPFRKQRYSK